MEEKDLKSIITDFVSEAWKRGEPVLLSQIGQLNDGSVGKDAKTISGRLSTFITTHLREYLILIKHSSMSPLIGVIPRDQDTENFRDIDQLLEKKRGILLIRSGQPRLIASFWAAFRKLLDSNQRRFINVIDKINFVNQPADEDVPVGMLEIRREYIAQNDLETDREIFQKIEKWCLSNSVPLSKFEKNVEETLHHKTKLSARNQESLLDRMLHLLNEGDLRRIKVTMDIVKKLSEEKD